MITTTKKKKWNSFSLDRKCKDLLSILAFVRAENCFYQTFFFKVEILLSIKM